MAWESEVADFAAALMAEIASLESDLEHDFRYVRLRELRRIYHLYGNPIADTSPATAPGQEPSTTERTQQRQTVRQLSPDRERALTAAKDYVTGLDRVVPTREILEYLVQNRINVGGASPLNNLSAMISTSGVFQSHGRKGWTMKDGSAPILTDDDYDQIVNEILDGFTPGEFSHVIAALEAHKSIPSDIDGRLLARSRERTNGKLLTEEQLRTLRKTFTNSIRNRAA